MALEPRRPAPCYALGLLAHLRRRQLSRSCSPPPQHERQRIPPELFNRATQALYPPGSTFKIVTLTGALENNVATESSVFKAPGAMKIGNGDVTNFNGRSYGEITLARATRSTLATRSMLSLA